MVGITLFWEGARLAHMGGWVCTRGTPSFGTQWPRRLVAGPGPNFLVPRFFGRGPEGSEVPREVCRWLSKFVARNPWYTYLWFPGTTCMMT